MPIGAFDLLTQSEVSHAKVRGLGRYVTVLANAHTTTNCILSRVFAQKKRRHLLFSTMVSTNRNETNASSPRTKTPARTLIRVRNNQRRHRERRRQYIASLEHKVLETERRLTQALVDIAKLRAELERPHPRGNEINLASDDALHVEAKPPAERGQEQECRILESQDTSSVSQEYNSCAPETSAATQHTRNYLPVVDPSNLQTILSFTQLDASTLTHHEDYSDHYQATFQPGCCSVAEEAPRANPTSLSAIVHPLSTSESKESILLSSFCSDYPPTSGQSTTPCVQALIFISQLNFRGLDSDAITSWLQPGFRRPTLPNEGCRVDSALLFELLDFISGA